jgi:acetylornithine deacetylase/succinyl-diaminopimelate desuccinylase-like protein
MAAQQVAHMHRSSLALAAVALAMTAPAAAADLKSQVEHYRQAHESVIVGQLDELIRCRSVAAEPGGIADAAARLEGWLSARGFRVRLLSAGPGTPPLVFGARDVPGAKRTVVFYAHYDGQPVTPSQWSSDPFVPVMRSGALGPAMRDIDWRGAPSPYDPQWRLFGRGAGDDKASIIAFLAAWDAIQQARRAPAVNVRVVWEGEEEAGSPHLAQLLKENRALLASDLWLIGDGPVHQSRRQMISFGARGVTGVEMTVYGPVRALHDGHYGNWVPNPAAMAAALLTAMRDDDGRILIPGFSDDVRPLTPAERQALAELPPSDAALRDEFAIGRTEGDEGSAASVMRPALNIRGIRAGQVGAAAANAIPVEATVSIDFRLVPDQTPAGVRMHLERFLSERGWTLVTSEPDPATRRGHARIARLTWESGYPALRSDMSTPVARSVIAAASAAAGRPVAVIPMMGGSVPIHLIATSSGRRSSACRSRTTTTISTRPTRTCGCRTCGTESGPTRHC